MPLWPAISRLTASSRSGEQTASTRIASNWWPTLPGVGQPSEAGRSAPSRMPTLGQSPGPGFVKPSTPANAVRLGLDAANAGHEAFALAQASAEVQERRMGEFLSSRPIRDAAFRHAVLSAYGSRCAVTGLRIVNGGGKAEAQAAHIVPVADGGPDVVRNGIALSGTAHWLFDRHLISLTDDYGLLVSHNKVPNELQGLFARQSKRIHLPEDPALRPHLGFVQRHRERFAAG